MIYSIISHKNKVWIFCLWTIKKIFSQFCVWSWTFSVYKNALRSKATDSLRFSLLSLIWKKSFAFQIKEKNKERKEKSTKRKSRWHDFFFLVRPTRLELVRGYPHAPQTCASANSATVAFCCFLETACAIIRGRKEIVNTLFYFYIILPMG